MEDKKVIKYYRSFYEISKELSKDQYYKFNNAIFSVLFFEKHIENINFEDKILKLLWTSVKHSISGSIFGFCGKKNIDYDLLFKGVSKGVDKGVSKGVIKGVANNVKEKEKEKDKEKDKENKIKLTKYISMTDEEFKKLINKYGVDLTKQTIEDMTLWLGSKGKKYKDYYLACIKWIKKRITSEGANARPYDKIKELVSYINNIKDEHEQQAERRRAFNCGDMTREEILYFCRNKKIEFEV